MGEDKLPTTEQVLEKEPASTTVEKVEPSKETQKQPPLPPEAEARIQQMIAEATQKAIEQGKELGKREMQGIKDREVTFAQRKAELAERRAKAYETEFTTADDETKAQIEQKRLRGEVEYFRTKEQEEEQERQRGAYFASLDNLRQEHLKSYGIDPTDKRIDWGNKEDDFISGWAKFDASVNKIVKENQGNLEKILVTKAEERFKQLESDFRKQHGLDSHDTTTGSGVTNTDDAEFMRAFGAYELPDNKENRARYEEIKKKYY